MSLKNTHRPRPVSDFLPGLTKDIFGRKNMLFGKMVAEWPAIAGAEISAHSVPLDLKFQRSKKATAADTKTKAAAPGQAVLHLAVQSGYALELSYQKSLLIERLNIFFGYGAIKDIKIIQNSEVMANKKPPATPPRRLKLGEEQQIDAIVAEIKENDLQTALKNLGKAIASRNTGSKE